MDASTANERSAVAQKDGAYANERAAMLEKEAATARLEVERLKSRLAWREINKENSDFFGMILSGAPKAKIIMVYLNNNPEAASFAAQLSQMLKSAGYDAPDSFDKLRGILPIGGMMIGVSMRVKDAKDPAAVALQGALKSINSDAPAQVVSGLEQGTIQIDVGQKVPQLH